MKTFRFAATAGFLAVSLAGAALAQDTSGTMPASSAMTPQSQMAPAPAVAPMAPSADTAATNSSVTTAAGATVEQTTVTNGPIPDTAANRAKYGAPMSHAGKHTKPAGN